MSRFLIDFAFTALGFVLGIIWRSWLYEHEVDSHALAFDKHLEDLKKEWEYERTLEENSIRRKHP